MNPFIFGGPVPPNDFFGRQDSIQFIMDRLYGRSRSSIALWGDRRVGKTSLLHTVAQPKLRAEWVDNPGRHTMLFLDCQMFAEFTWQKFWETVLDEISGWVTDTDLPRQAEKLLDEGVFAERKLIRFFRRMQRQGETLTLLLDEFTSLVSASTADEAEQVRDLLGFLRTLITAVNPATSHPRPLAIITSTRRPLDEVCRPLYGESDIGSPFYNPLVAERLKPFTETDVRELLDKRLAETAVTFSETEVEHLLAMAGRHPILVQSYASELFNARRKDEDVDFTAVDRQFADRNRTHFHDLWLYSSPAEQQFLAELNQDESNWSDLTPAQANARRQLRERGLLRHDRLFSPLFADWLRLNRPQLLQEASGGPNITQLLRILTEYFNEEELRTLCLELDVGYDSLPGRGMQGKARELADWMRRHGRLAELVDLVREKRPSLDV